MSEPKFIEENFSALSRSALSKGDARATADGYTFNISDDRWIIPGEGKTHRFDLSMVSRTCAPHLDRSLREGLVDLLVSNSVSTAKSSMNALKRFLEFCEERFQKDVRFQEITGKYLDSYLNEKVSASDKALKPLLETFVTWERPGLSACGWNSLKGRSFKQKRTYIDVLTLHPKRGPYIDSELYAIEDGLRYAYEVGRIGEEKYLTVMFFNLFGQRPATNAKLKIGDVRTPKHHGDRCATVRFPLVKQRRRGALTRRTHGVPRKVPIFFAKVLEAYLDERFKSVPENQRDLLPLFRAESPEFRVGANSAGQTASGYAGHANADTLNIRYQRIIKSLNIISPRTGERLKANPNRARHTVGTQLAMRGATAAAIAAWLEHQSELSCEAYVTVATQHFQLMSSLLDGQFTHLAGQFLGEIISGNEIQELDLSSVIFDVEDAEFPSLGACAEGGCAAVESLDAPYACFICPNFMLSSSANLRPLLQRLKDRHILAAGRGDSVMLSQIERISSSIVVACRAQDIYDG